MCKLFGGDYCKAPYQDPFFRYRSILASNEIFGTRDCYSGYEGFVNSDDSFGSCHLTIYEPTYFEENYISILIWIILSVIFVLVWIFLRRKKAQKEMKFNQIERRKRWRELQDREMTPTITNQNDRTEDDDVVTTMTLEKTRISALTHRTSSRLTRPETGGGFSRISAFTARTSTRARVRPETGGGLSAISALTHRTTTAKPQLDEIEKSKEE